MLIETNSRTYQNWFCNKQIFIKTNNIYRNLYWKCSSLIYNCLCKMSLWRINIWLYNYQASYMYVLKNRCFGFFKFYLLCLNILTSPTWTTTYPELLCKPNYMVPVYSVHYYANRCFCSYFNSVLIANSEDWQQSLQGKIAQIFLEVFWDMTSVYFKEDSINP